MAKDNRMRQAVLRTCIVFALAALVLATSLPDLRRVWQPAGDPGYVIDFNAVITETRPQGPADHVGLRAGARIDIPATDPQYKFLVIYAGTPFPGQQLRFAVEQGGLLRRVTLITEPEPMGFTTQLFIIIRVLAMLFFVGIGATLVLLRPSIATWGFYFYCLGLNGAASFLAPMLVGSPWSQIIFLTEGMLTGAGFAGVAVFGAYFLRERPTGWRRYVIPIVSVALLVLFAFSTFLWPAINAGRSLGVMGNIREAILAFMGIIAMYALIETYVVARGADRQRIRWVVLGFGIALAGQVTDSLMFRHPPPYWVHASLLLSGVLVPITVAYAVIKHRVIDVSFVVSRALVYAILTTALVGIFSLLDWFFTDYLRLARLGTLAEVGAVVAFGFWFNALHRRVDSFIDATFFRQRHQAEVQLARVAAALPLATAPTTVAHFLVREPMRTLGLASAALFKRDRDGTYLREQSEGWSPGSLTHLDASDEPLLVLAQATHAPLSLYEHPWHRSQVPGGAARPALALPIVVRGELTALVLYGSHIHGEAIDPDEARLIGNLATGASAAYDHLEADGLRRENEALRRVIAQGQIQPA